MKESSQGSAGGPDIGCGLEDPGVRQMQPLVGEQAHHEPFELLNLMARV